MERLKGSAEIWTRILGFRVQSASHYTTEHELRELFYLNSIVKRQLVYFKMLVFLSKEQTCKALNLVSVEILNPMIALLNRKIEFSNGSFLSESWKKYPT